MYNVLIRKQKKKRLDNTLQHVLLVSQPSLVQGYISFTALCGFESSKLARQKSKFVS